MATKTSASAFNSYFYQQQHQSSSNPNSKQMEQPFGNSDQLSDIHVKMSKKIAQLTKVIYALNSKNDESESLISNLKTQYEEEKEQLISETCKKIEDLKAKIIFSNDQSKKIASLESTIKDYEVQKERAIKEMEQFKLRSIENEESLVMTHRDEIIELNQMLEKVKQDYQNLHQKNQDMVKKYEQDTLYLIEDTKSKHRLEIESLKQTYSSNKENFLAERQFLEEKHEQEIQNLRQEIDTLRSNYSKEKQDFEQNILKLKTFHQKELEALRQNSNSEYEKFIASLKSDLDSVSNEKNQLEVEMTKKYNSKLEQIVTKEEEITQLNEFIAELKLKFEGVNSNYFELNEKIVEISAKNQSLESKLAEIESENQQLKEKNENQSRQLIDKSNEMSKIEASTLQKSSLISDLKHELNETKKRLAVLEKEKKIFENESLSVNDRNSNLIKSLERQIESLNNEKISMTKDYDIKIEDLDECNKRNIDQMKTEYQIEKQSIIDQYESRLSMETTLYQEKILTLERDLTKNFNSENQKLLNENTDLKLKYEKLLENFKLKTKNLEENYQILQDKFDQLKIELNENLALNNKLNLNKNKLECELNTANDLSKRRKTRIDELEKELENLRFVFESTTKDNNLEYRIQIEKLNKELNEKWEETLRSECEKLRIDLHQIKDEEKRSELEKLKMVKDEELENLKSNWQTITNELLEEISLLKKELSEKELTSNKKLEKLKYDLELENRDLIEKLNRLNDEYKAKLDELQSQQNLETKTLIENLTKQNEDKIAELKQRHLHDLKSQSIAQKAALSSMKESMQNSKNLELEMQQESFHKQKELMKYELQQEYFTEMDKIKHESEMEIMTIRCELERVVELNKQKEREFEIKIDDYQSEVRSKQKQIDKINNEMNDLKLLNNTLKEEIDLKQREIKQIRADLQKELRQKESLINQKKEEEINRLNGEHMRQKQTLVNEFKQAQELLKEKIIETDEKLREMHDRYLNRESRQEDLDMIENLKKNLSEKEEFLKKLQNEKQYFQMELVNRENNFNKIFNTMPNIGTINPLGANTKIKTKSNTTVTKYQPSQQQSLQNAQTGSFGRLEPLPGKISPLHDVNLNPNRPLPKKFLI